MALYEFRCYTCNAVTERHLKITDDTRAIECPECHSVAERIISLSSFHLKGPGFHKNDYGTNTTAGKDD